MPTKQAVTEVPDPWQAKEALERALFEIRKVIAGQDVMLERVLVCLLTGGHLLIEGVPGLAKTLTVKTTAAVLGGTFKRVQFTPDLVPSDLVGTRLFRPDRSEFEIELGPVFCNFLLLIRAARALAVLRGRDYVLVQDIDELAKDALRHRLVLSYEALADERTPDALVDEVMAAVPAPHIDLTKPSAA